MDQTVPTSGRNPPSSDDVPTAPTSSALRFSTFDPSDHRLQIINDDKLFSPIVAEYMKKHWCLADKGFDYNVVAVFGSQSTGKSTLLNRLFGTNFDVMNESTGRQQTTKGIWVSKADSHNTLVLDVEGTDGGERFEDQDFERKSALFSLAISEVVIVNIYENNIGLYNGANLGLLKTVLDVNLQLFQQAGSPKTCLHFVIRDFTAQTPLERLQATIMGYLEKIWDSLAKPAAKANCSIHDFFVFNITGLPHKIFARDAFESSVSKLRVRFSDKSAPDYVFTPDLHKRVPADGFGAFANSIWDRISLSKELDLPTQTQLLAVHRCDEIAREVFDEKFIGSAEELRVVDGGRVLENFGVIANNVVDECLARFDEAGSRYNEAVFKRKHAEFFKRMSTYLLPMYHQQLANVARMCLDTFTKSVASNLAAEAESGATLNFSRVAQAATTTGEATFREYSSASRLKNAEDWTPDVQFGQLVAEMDKISSEKRKEAIDKMCTGVEKLAVAALQEAVVGRLNDTTNTVGMWKDIIHSLRDAMNLSEVQIEKKGSGFEGSPDELKAWKATLKWQIWVGLLDSLKKETSDDAMLARLKGIFESKFRYDDKGVPRLWNLDDPIDIFYSSSVDDAEKALNVYAKMDFPLKLIGEDILEDQRFDPLCVSIIPAHRLQSIRDRFKKEANVMYVEAKRSMVVTTARIPPWFFALTLILGWNELMMVLFNPVYFALLAIFAGGFYISWQYGLIGPIYKVVKATLSEVGSQAVHELKKNGVDVPAFFGGDIDNEDKETKIKRRGTNRDRESRRTRSEKSESSQSFEMEERQ
ncbi:Dynamin-like GTPase that mediates homotypic ER fusion, partial [Entophlyctis sp. JEL0112]